MRLFILIIAFFILFFNNARTQDLIVTNTGDSLNCKITKLNKNFVFFAFKYKNEIKNTVLSVNNIKFYKQNFYIKSDIPKEELIIKKKDYKKIIIGGYGGYSYFTGKVSDEFDPYLQNYLKELKSGYHFGADASYFFTENMGLGLKYSIVRTENHRNDVTAVNKITGLTSTGLLKDDITIQYLGPTFSTRFTSFKSNNYYIISISLGYLDYKNNATLIDEFKLTSGTLGLCWDLSANLEINKELNLGLGFSYTIGTLNQYNYNDGIQTKVVKLEKDKFENISRIDLSIALRWNK